MFDFDQLGHDLFFEAPKQKEFAVAVVLGIGSAATFFFDQVVFGWALAGASLSSLRWALVAARKERENLGRDKTADK